MDQFSDILTNYYTYGTARTEDSLENYHLILRRLP